MTIKQINGEAIHTLLYAVGGFKVENKQIQDWVKELTNNHQPDEVKKLVSEVQNLVPQWANLSKTSKENVRDNNDYGGSYIMKYNDLSKVLQNNYGIEVETCTKYLARSQTNPQTMIIPEVESKFKKRSAAKPQNSLETQLISAYNNSFDNGQPTFAKFKSQLGNREFKGSLQECFNEMKEFYKGKETTADNNKRDIGNYEKLGGLMGLTPRNQKKYGAKVKFDKFIADNSTVKGIV